MCVFIGALVDLQSVPVDDGLGVAPTGTAAPTAPAGSGAAVGAPAAGGATGLGVAPAGFGLVESVGLGVVLSVDVGLGVVLGLGLGLGLWLGLVLVLGLGEEELVLGLGEGPVLAPLDGVQPGVCWLTPVWLPPEAPGGTAPPGTWLPLPSGFAL